MAGGSGTRQHGRTQVRRKRFGARTQRAVQNFPISGIQLPPAVRPGIDQGRGSWVNRDLGLLTR
jgi:hypothetical protein